MPDSILESRLRVDLTAVVITVLDGEPLVLTVQRDDGKGVGLPSGPLQRGHRSLQEGLRAWVERQTNRRLGYVEQLYTFADRRPEGPDHPESDDYQAVSIAYLALVPDPGEDVPLEGRWRHWYGFFPWEDLRQGVSPARTLMLGRMHDWAAGRRRPADRSCRERVDLVFGTGETFDEERTLERYEMLYEAGLVAEAMLDHGETPPADILALPGLPMMADHRRILATAISRLRAKIKYRPVLFELMPPAFTLSDLQRTAEALSGVALHKQNFRRLVAQQGLVEETGELATDTGGRPARLVRFRREVLLERPAPGVRLGARTRTAGA
ncbi:MAG: hypothetical protein VYB54_06880 [Pseudomonadota bacterium]|nr:hypothetical protein [Pseudomonadota bacterium]